MTQGERTAFDHPIPEAQGSVSLPGKVSAEDAQSLGGHTTPYTATHGRPSCLGRNIPPLAPSLLFLAAILGVTFLPLLVGYNFLPFERFPTLSCAITRTGDGSINRRSQFLEQMTLVPWMHDKEPAVLTLFIPQDQNVARELRRGRLPLWDPYIGGGMPTLDAGQYRPLNPLRVPFYLWPTAWMYSLGLFFAVALAALGMWRFLGDQGLSPLSASLGAAVFSLNPWVLWDIALPNAGAYLAFPWVLLTFGRIRPGAPKSLAWAALALTLMGHVGHIEVCLVLTLCATLFFWIDNHSFDGTPHPKWARLQALGGVALLTLACLAMLWVPMVRFFGQSFSYKALRIPVLFGYDWRVFTSASADLFLPAGLMGLAFASLAVWRKVGVWWAILAGALLTFLPLPLLGYAIPNALSQFVGLMPAYFKPVVWCALSILVAQGAEALCAVVPRARAWALWAGGLFFLLALVTSLVVPIRWQEQGRYLPILAVLSLAGLGAVWVLGQGALGGQRRWIAAALLALPLAFPTALDCLPWNREELGGNPLLVTLSERFPHNRTVSVFNKTTGWALPTNQGTYFQVRCIESNAAFYLNRYFELFSDTKHFPTWLYFDVFNPLAFRQAGASIALLPNGRIPPQFPVLVRGSSFSACAIVPSAGRVYFAEHARTLDPQGDLAKQILELGPTSEAVAVLEGMGQSTPEVWPQTPPDEARVGYLEDDIHRVVLATESKAQGVLVLKDSWYPGWAATIDGASTPIYRVNGCFRGVLVPAGRHKVQFQYRSWPVLLSGMISLVATLGLLWVVLGKRGTRSVTSSVDEEPVPRGPSKDEAGP